MVHSSGEHGGSITEEQQRMLLVRTFCEALSHGPSQSGPYSGERDLLATFALNFFSYLVTTKEFCCCDNRTAIGRV